MYLLLECEIWKQRNNWQEDYHKIETRSTHNEVDDPKHVVWAGSGDCTVEE